MNLFAKCIAGVTLAIGAATAAGASDTITLPVGTATDEIGVYDAGFDWNGFYAGVYGAGQFSPDKGSQFGGGVSVGVNATFDFFLVGAEVAVQGLVGDTSGAYAEVLARGGVLVTDDVVVYAATGIGMDFATPVGQDVLLGGGVEMAVTDNLSLEAQYLHGFPITDDSSSDQFTLGANFHF